MQSHCNEYEYTIWVYMYIKSASLCLSVYFWIPTFITVVLCLEYLKYNVPIVWSLLKFLLLVYLELYTIKEYDTSAFEITRNSLNLEHPCIHVG